VAYTGQGTESELFAYGNQQWSPLTLERRVDVPGVELGRAHQVRRVLREATRVVWKGVSGSLVDADDDWARFRLSRPTPDVLSRTGAEAVRRGVYEKWVERGEIAPAI
jgi:hypothetical protein